MSSIYRESKRIPLDKIFFVIACVYLGVVVAWLVNRQRQRVETARIPAVSENDRRFIRDLHTSLEAIARQTPTAPPVTTAPSPTVTLPPPPPVTTATTTPAPRVIERVYVPVYPRATPAARPVTPPVPVAVAPSPIAPPAVVPAPPVAPVLPTSGRVKNTLVGVMELGDRSSALFDNKGVTTRISTGEFINGWTLMEVRGQQAILSRGGKVKVLEVGQSF